QYSERYGYTRLICEPYKFEGKISNFPLQLSFISRRDTDSITTGNICYSSDGVIQKAEVRIRKEYGWGFYFITENKQLILQKAESTLRPNKYGQPTTVYQDKSLIEYERARKLDLEKYEWIKANIPANCPKSFAGFRRMKNANSKNYQKIVAEAAALGKQI
ncbi:MAG: hypothetical protein LIO52_02700, partial [Oscillospiraceae bacterium]|nr:hypothetical protein [Oscillospiraceae bacterium]